MSEIFLRRVRLAAPAAEVFAWHESPGALEALTPPWEKVRVIHKEGSIHEGDRTRLRVSLLGPIGMSWVARHERYQAGRSFTDVAEGGPFAVWEHTHTVEPEGGGCVLEDRIKWAVRGGVFGKVAVPYVRRRLEKMFDFRHEVMRRLFG